MYTQALDNALDIIGLQKRMSELANSPDLLYGYLINFFMDLPETHREYVGKLKIVSAHTDIMFSLTYITDIVKLASAHKYFTFSTSLNFGTMTWHRGCILPPIDDPRLASLCQLD